MTSSSSQSPVNINTTSTSAGCVFLANKVQKDRSWYLPLSTAIIKGNWESAKRFFELDPDAITATVGTDLETALHIAIATANEIHFVEKLVELMPPEALAQKDDVGTALCTVGNIEVAKLYLAKNANFAYMLDVEGVVPLYSAAQNGHKV